MSCYSWLNHCFLGVSGVDLRAWGYAISIHLACPKAYQVTMANGWTSFSLLSHMLGGKEGSSSNKSLCSTSEAETTHNFGKHVWVCPTPI